MKKFTLLLTAILLLGGNLMAQFAPGSGDGSSPAQAFLITEPAHLNYVRNYLGAEHEGNHFKLMNDISLEEIDNWQPIGDVSNRFEGNFNGNGNKVTNLKISRSTTHYVGLFGHIGENAHVYKLGVIIDEEAFVLGASFVGGLAGSTRGTISQCYVVGEVRSNQTNSRIGVFAGKNLGQISESYSIGKVFGRQRTGGFVGVNWEAEINNCYSTADVKRQGGSSGEVGGFVGFNRLGEVLNSYSTGKVTDANDEPLSDKGFCGDILAGVGYDMSGNFWNTETSGIDGTAGVATGITSAKMKQQDTFDEEDWDFPGTWSIISEDGSVSYPYLTENVKYPYPGLVAAWNGDGSWDDAVNWFENTVPGEGADVRVHTGHLTIDQSVDVGVMTVAPSANLTLEAGNTLKTSRLTMESHGEYVEGARDNISVASFVNMGTVDADVIEYERYVPAGAFEYISPPLNMQKSDVFAPLSNVSGIGRGLFTFDESADDWNWLEDNENVFLK